VRCDECESEVIITYQIKESKAICKWCLILSGDDWQIKLARAMNVEGYK
tara:strand:+ start:401 stop:547 length:147 start_codon:yes stop_codon:yes gene_type:complete